MSRKVIIWADAGAVLGTILGIVSAVTYDCEMPVIAHATRAALIWGAVWLSICAMTGAIVTRTEEKGLTSSGLALGLMATVTSAVSIGIVWSVLGSVAQGRFLERSNPWGMNNNDPNLFLFGIAVEASVSAVAAAVLSFLASMSIALARRRSLLGR